MYAIVDIAGQQFKVKKDQKIFVHRLDSEVGSQVDFDKVLLIDNEKSVVVGEPLIEGALITAKVLEHLKGDKVIVFKKKRRKGYKVKNGHRQFFTQLLIEEIVEKGGQARPLVKAKKAEKPVAEEAVVEVSPTITDVKPEVAKSETAEERVLSAEVPVKKAAAKKPAAKETKTKAGAETSAEEKAEAKPKTKAAPKKAEAKTASAKKVEKPAAAKKSKKADDKDE